MTRPNRRTILAPLFAVLAILLGVSGSASGAFNHAATEVHYEDFLLWETKALGVPAFEIADPTRGNGEWVYDDASGVLFYVRQNPWTMFDPLGLQSMSADRMVRHAVAKTHADHDIGTYEQNLAKATRQDQSARAQGGAIGLTVMGGGTVGFGLKKAGWWGLSRFMTSPTAGYTAAETVSTGFELALGYDGPPIIPGPGDVVRLGVNSAKETGKNSRKIVEVFGGKSGGGIKGAVNFDKIAETGIKGDVANFSKHFPGTLDEVVASNPYIKGGGGGSMDWLPNVAGSLKKGGELVLNSTARNPYGVKEMPTAEQLAKIGLKIKEETGPLAERFAEQTFRTTDGAVIPNEKMTTTVFEKIDVQ